MGIKLTNNANATLAAGINSSATSITLTSGQGARFPTLTASDYFYATLVDTSNNLEIVKCTARSTDVLTVVRAQETTTARAYSTGDRIEIRITAQTFIDATALTPAAVSDQVNTSTGAFDLPSGTTGQRPASPVSGYIRFNTTTGYAEYYNGADWQSIAGPYNMDYLVVGGGGSGGNGFSNTTGTTAGGGAGGYISSTNNLITPGVAYAVTVGAGAAGVQSSSGSSTFGNTGVNSSLIGTGISATAQGGGRGGFDSNAGGNGGSGGGGGSSAAAGGSGTAGQGNAGGAGGTPAGGGGGGGAGSAGGGCTNAGGGGTSGAGGSGTAWLNGTTYAGGGGGGGAFNTATITPGAGGSGGGTAGGIARSAGGTSGGPGVGTISSNNATANTGSGSGGGGSQDSTGAAAGSGNGGSGVVIIRYAGTVTRGSGGTVTTSGGYTYHTFTSSGTYTA